MGARSAWLLLRSYRSAPPLRFRPLLLLLQPRFLCRAWNPGLAAALALTERVGKQLRQARGSLLAILVLATAATRTESHHAIAVDAVGETLTEARALLVTQRSGLLHIELELDARR